MTILGYGPLIWVPLLSGLMGLGTVTGLLQNAETRHRPWRELFVAWLISSMFMALFLSLLAWLFSDIEVP